MPQQTSVRVVISAESDERGVAPLLPSDFAYHELGARSQS